MKLKYNLVMVFSSIFLTLMTKGIVDVVLPLYLKDLGIALIGMGFIFSLAPIFGMIVPPIVAVHSDVVGRKGYFSLTFLFRSIAYGFYSICKIPIGFAILNTLDSLSQYFRMAVEMPLVMDISPLEKRDRILSAYWGIFGVAVSVGMLISGIILLFIGFFWLFVLCSLISFFGFVLSKIVRIPAFKRKNVIFDLKKTFNFRELSWNLKILFISSLFTGLAFTLVERFAFPIFLQQDLQASPSFIGITIGLAWLAMGIPPLIWRNMTETNSPVKLYFYGSVLYGTSTLFMSFTPNLISTISFYILGGFFWGFAGAANMKMLADSANRADRARDISLSRLGGGIGAMVGSIASGIISQIIGFRPLFIISSILSFVSATIVLLAVLENDRKFGV